MCILEYSALRTFNFALHCIVFRCFALQCFANDAGRFTLTAQVGGRGRSEGQICCRESYPTFLIANYKEFGANLEFVSDRSSEGNQFVKGFGGIGAMLRYKVNFEQLADYSDDDEFYDGTYPVPLLSSHQTREPMLICLSRLTV